MKIGIYGGTFNPVHLGHIEIVKHIIKNVELDKIIIIPVGNAPHKKVFLSGEKRLEMCKIAFEGMPKVEVSSIEVDGEGKSYTYKTLMSLKELYKDSEFYEIIGEDSADYLEKWRDYDKLIEEAKFIVLKREGFNYEATHKNIVVLETPLLPFSSTEVRRLSATGEDISKLVSKGIEEYITLNNLYKGN